MVLNWTEALSMAIDNRLPAPAESRVYAMVTLAVHDALNNVVPEYETYALDNSWNDGKEVSKKTIGQAADAAVAQAAHDVLVALVPAWTVNADNLLQASLLDIEESEVKSLGIQIGKDAAAAVLTKRQNDVLPGFASYPQGTLPGEYRSTLPFAVANPVWPDNSVYGQDWGETEPFGTLTGDQFRPEPPHEIDSPDYTADYNEVKILGSNSSTVRSPEQTAMAIFLTDNMPSIMNRVARSVALSEELNGWETARLFALVQMAVADALIAAMEGAYYYNFWRPVTAIQNGETDGNNDTAGDPGWIPLLSARPTPPLPSYPSGYAAAGSAGAQVFKLFFGTDNISFTIGSYSLPGTERTYTQFSQLAAEMAQSRIYAGHNFRNDNVAGRQLGKALGKYVFTRNLEEIKNVVQNHKE